MSRLLGAVVIVALLPAFAWSVPLQINFQGAVEEDGAPLPDGTYNAVFRLYNAPTGGLLLWSEIQSVSVATGFFSVILGAVTPLEPSFFEYDNLYISIEISGEELPRQKIVSVPFTIRTADADHAAEADVAASADVADDLDCAGCVDTVHLADAAVTGDKVGLETITGDNIDDGSIDGDDEIAAGSIGGTLIANGAIGSTKLADGSVTSAKINDGAIVDADISPSANISPSKVSGTAWTGSNDGSGSGLDADRLDNLNSTQFLRSDASGTLTGNLEVTGIIETNDLNLPYADNAGIFLRGYNASFPWSNRIWFKGSDISGYEDAYLYWRQGSILFRRSGVSTNTVASLDMDDEELKVTNTHNGDRYAIAGIHTGTSGNSQGVYGETHAPGSATGSSMGVYGWAKSPVSSGGAAFGVLGRSNAVPGAVGSTSAGVFGWGDIGADGRVYGVWGETTSTGDPNAYVAGVYGVATATTGNVMGIIGVSNSPSGKGVYFSGGLAGSGTKSAVVRTSEGPVELYAQESPENWFEDFGTAQLRNGRVTITLDPLFQDTVTIDAEHPMHVFIQLEGDCRGVFVEKETDRFTVRELGGGLSSAKFSYRVVAKRRGFENLRLKKSPAGYADPALYPEKAGLYKRPPIK